MVTGWAAVANRTVGCFVKGETRNPRGRSESYAGTSIGSSRASLSLSPGREHRGGGSPVFWRMT
jgi:hypothetical protein